MKTNKKLISRNDNARKWKHALGGTLIPKHETGTGKDGVVYTRLDVESLKKDPRYKLNYNWHINKDNIEIIQDSLINRGANLALRRAILANIIAESGGETKPHGNGAFGLIGWRGVRAEGLPTTLDGQIHYLMNETFSNPSGKNWKDGGVGTGVNTGKEMYLLFNTTQNTNQATAAFTRGFVRPPASQYDIRKSLAQLLREHMK